MHLFRRRIFLVAIAVLVFVAAHAVPVYAQSDIDDLIPPGSDADTTSADADQAALDSLKAKNQEQAVAPKSSSMIRSLFSAADYKTDAASANLPARVGRVINIVFAISGTVFLAMVIYAGVRWMTAGGDSDQVKKSQKRITRASVGLLILLMSWIVTSFVLRGVLIGSESANRRYTSPGGTFQIDAYPR